MPHIPFHTTNVVLVFRGTGQFKCGLGTNLLAIGIDVREEDELKYTDLNFNNS